MNRLRSRELGHRPSPCVPQTDGGKQHHDTEISSRHKCGDTIPIFYIFFVRNPGPIRS